MGPVPVASLLGVSKFFWLLGQGLLCGTHGYIILFCTHDFKADASLTSSGKINREA